MSRLIIASNRCVSGHVNDYIDPFSEAIDGIMKKHPGLWFGWNGEIHQDSKNRTHNSSTLAETEFHTWDMSPREYDNYYHGYIHKVMWPVFHNRPDLALYQKEYFLAYKEYTSFVAGKLTQHLCPDDLIWVQDYHLLPVGRMIKDAGFLNRSGFFLHQPFPPGDVFNSIPEHNWLMQSLFHYDLIGFQSSSDVNNFISYLMRYYLAERLSPNLIMVNGHRFMVGIFPCGISTQPLTHYKESRSAEKHTQKDGNRRTIISNDVINDITGIHYRLDAMRSFLNSYPQYVRDVSLFQISDPAQEYPNPSSELRHKLECFCSEINGLYGDFSWSPVNYIHNDFCSREAIYTFYSSADVALFTPLSEGMNLSAKEFILAQDPEDPGVLILSPFTGAAEQLDDAMIINPYNPDETGEALHSALSMSLHERKRRYNNLIKKVKQFDNQWWGNAFLQALNSNEKKPYVADALCTSMHYGVFTPKKQY